MSNDRLDTKVTHTLPLPTNLYGHCFDEKELRQFAQYVVPVAFSQDEHTKSNGKEIESIIPFSETPWYCALDDSLANELINKVYLINYKYNQGFAIICTDNRTDQLLGYSDNGNIIIPVETKNGTYDITGEHTIDEILTLLPYYFSGLDQYLIPYPSFQEDSLDANGFYYCAPEAYYSSWYITDLSTAHTNASWGQLEPYNYYFEPQTNSPNGIPYKPYVGCAAIAIGQILNRYCAPEQIAVWTDWTHSIDLDWPYYGQVSAVRDSTHALASLLRVLADVLDSEFYYNGTATSTVNIKAGLDAIGYTYDNFITTDMDNYNLYRIAQSISNGRPVIAFGAPNIYSSGHFWDIEGYRKEQRERLIEWSVYNPNMEFVGRWASIIQNSTQDHVYVYCNWGFDGQYNGWFISQLFNPNGASFSSNLKIVSNIRPL